ncbi:MAG: 50S ribosomal protein L11 methyltransferase, partial [Bacillota bacterium]|nr:50S ribosomal protein L11 methyltransferase [Bacillota bacterium]
MEWAEITVVTSAEAVEAVSNRFQELGAQGTVISDPEPVLGQTSGEVRVSAYFPVDGRLERRVQEIREFVAGLGQYGLAPGPGRVEVRRVEDEDWAEAWKSYYRPIRVGRRILVRPSWEEAPAEGVVIELDPGMAFGTGTHPTTALCLEVLEEVLRQGEAVWDLGTGSGILAIGAARLGAGRVEAFDVDPVAVQAARRNAARNGVADVVSVHERDVAAAGENLPQELSHAPDVIVVNIIAEV